MAVGITESTVEDVALFFLSDLGYALGFGGDIAPDTPRAERVSYGDVVLLERLRLALMRINQRIPADATEETLRKIIHPGQRHTSL